MAAEELIFGKIGKIVVESMMYGRTKPIKLYNHIQTAESADHIRSVLPEMGLVAFVPVDSIFPKRDDDLTPIIDTVPFDCDGSLKVTIKVPNGEPVTGMRIPRGSS